MERRIGLTRLVLRQGDLTLESADAVVNAANPGLLGGGGVDGAIHRRGGPAILQACRRIREASGPLPPGQAVITTGGNLKARWVIHTAGPVWKGGGHEEDQWLAACYESCLNLARERDLKSLAFPSISTGAYRFPLRRAARIALKTVVSHLRPPPGDRAFERVAFVLFTEKDYAVYAESLEEIAGKA